MNAKTFPQVKQQLLGSATAKLPLQKGVDQSGVETGWFRNWDFDNRVAIVIHQDTIAKIKADANLDTLGIKTSTEKVKDDAGMPTGEEYTQHIIVCYKPIVYDITL